MKKILAIILAMATVLSLCACGGGNSNGGGGTNAEGKVKLSIGIPSNALILSHKNNALTRWVEKECNVDLTFEEYAGGTDVATQITTTVAARQELPDILFGVGLNQGAITRYGKDGYFVDLTKYYEDKEGASKIFWDRMNNELTDYERELVWNKLVDAETGGIYGVPCVETSLIDKMRFQPWINQQWLDDLGMKAPTNTDELLEFLRAVKKNDMNKNGDPTDEIPLFGVQGGLGSRPITWLINMFLYYNSSKPYCLDANGKVYAAYTTDEYREALKFIRQLYTEGLLSPMTWTSSSTEMRSIVTGDIARAGVFLTHLTTGAARNSATMYEYVPLENWGWVIRDDTSFTLKTFITEDCDNPDKAFEVLMKLWSWEGSMRVRYGEYEVNWTDADEGAKSDLGLDATYKLISDALTQQNTAKWAVIASTLNVYAEGETAQIAENMSEWETKKSAMHAESYRLFEKREAECDYSMRMPTLNFTQEESDRLDQYRTNLNDRRDKAQTEFITGVMNINSDADWNAYLKQMDELGLQIVLQANQTVYDRMYKK